MLKTFFANITIYVIFFCFFFGTDVCGQSRWLKNEKLTVVVTEDSTPWAYKKGGKIMGIDYEALQAIAKRMGFEFEFELYPFKRVYSYIERGQSDAVLLLYRTKQREKTVHYNLSPMHYSTYYVFTKKGWEFPFNSIDDLYGKVIIKNRGFAISPDFDRAESEKKIVIRETESRENLINITLAGRVDAFVSNYAGAKLEIKKLGVKGRVSQLPKPLIEKGVYFALSRKASNIRDKGAFLKAFNKALLEIKQEGLYAGIVRKYLD